MMITHNSVLPSLWLLQTHTSSVTHILISHPLTAVSLPPPLFSSYSLSTIQPSDSTNHSAPRSWHERDFCLRNLPASRSRGYRGTRLDRKRLAREVMLSRRPPPLKSSAVIPGGHGDWPLASRTAHSRTSRVRWSREAEISRKRQLKRAALDMASEGKERINVSFSESSTNDTSLLPPVILNVRHAVNVVGKQQEVYNHNLGPFPILANIQYNKINILVLLY